MRYFFVNREQIRNGKATITGSDARHIRNVLRLGSGEMIGLYDGMGLEHEARIDTVSQTRVEVSILSSGPSVTESPLRITVVQALLKDRKMDGLIRQLTELGIAEWIPVIAARSVPKPNAQRLPARMARWEKITREAQKQCRRGRVVGIRPPLSFEEMLALGENHDLRIIFHEDAAVPLQSDINKNPSTQTAIVAVGPEGGFSDQEVELAKAHGFRAMRLGPRILRAETATVAACSLVQFIYGDMGLREAPIPSKTGQKQESESAVGTQKQLDKEKGIT